MRRKKQTIREHGAHSIDTLIGLNIRRERVANGFTQQQLAARLDVSFQQFQKYERGLNRLTPRKLLMLSQVMNVPVGRWFEGAEGTDLETRASNSEMTNQIKKDKALSRESLILVQNLAKMSEPQRHAFKRVVESLAEYS